VPSFCWTEPFDTLQLVYGDCMEPKQFLNVFF
jgi:hypothetical protein